MRPHLLLFDRVHHGGAENVPLESGIGDGHHKPDCSGGEKNRSGRERVGQSLMKYLRKRLAVEFDDSDGPRAAAHVDKVMRASKQLIEVVRQVAAGSVFANRCEVGSSLTIQ